MNKIEKNFDVFLLFVARMTRLFAYGLLSVILVIYLVERGLTQNQIGLLLSLTLAGDAVLSLWLSMIADRIGRKRILIIGASLMILAGILFVITNNFFVLLLAATIGVISPSGNEVGPFLAIEQSTLSQIVTNEKRTKLFAWYNLMGSFTTALGAWTGGWVIQIFQNRGMSLLESCWRVVIGYALCGCVLMFIFKFLSMDIEVNPPPRKFDRQIFFPKRLGLSRSHKIIKKLSLLFALDAYAGGFILQSIVAYWFYVRFGLEPVVLGSIFMAANVLAGLSGLLAAWLAKKIGLINTMVFTHIPSNILMILVPLMPNLPLAILMLLARFAISQMDVPTRQSYLMAVVPPEERSAAAGVTNVARTLGASLAPVFVGFLMKSAGLLSCVFYIAGGLKILYDLLLYRSFKAVVPPEEVP